MSPDPIFDKEKSLRGIPVNSSMILYRKISREEEEPGYLSSFLRYLFAFLLDERKGNECRDE